ncbi:MAG: TIGR02452 family protein [Muribaculaceae bacterium]|nr:TIGR02452 family protein [Muribaculaceae bacterium]
MKKKETTKHNHDGKTWQAQREDRIRIFHDTMRIVNSGGYVTETGRKVDLPVPAWMQEGTTVYSEPFSVNDVQKVAEGTRTYVVEGDCLETARRLNERGLNPAVLNMANRQHPGGGVLGGARAQEESIFRRSNLFRSLYQYFPYASSFGVEQKAIAYPLDRNFGGIYTPDAVVFRDTERTGYRLLEEPYRTSVSP